MANTKVKIRVTIFNAIFPERSIDDEMEISEVILEYLLNANHCYWDEEMGIYYTPDNSLGIELIG